MRTNDSSFRLSASILSLSGTSSLVTTLYTVTNSGSRSSRGFGPLNFFSSSIGMISKINLYRAVFFDF